MGNPPTCVGKTEVEKGSTPSRQKHPHVRGEDSQTSINPRSWQETPPRAWGRPGRLEAHPQELGNTPTCVGKTELW